MASSQLNLNFRMHLKFGASGAASQRSASIGILESTSVFKFETIDIVIVSRA
jgi:hypothetical protein